MLGRRTPNGRFFRPPSPPFQPCDFRLPPRELLARELASDTVVIARPTGGHFGRKFVSLRKKASCIVSPWRNEGRLALLAFCHGLLKFEPQNARLRTAKVTGAVSGKRLCKEACSARMGASQLWSCLVLRGMEASQLPGL